MEHKEHLETLNKDMLQKLDDYMKAKSPVADEHSEKINTARDKWQASWNEFLQTLLTLEKLEI